jgi:hypothetical protein
MDETEVLDAPDQEQVESASAPATEPATSEPVATDTPDVATDTPEPTTGERARDEQGRFIAKDQPADTATATAAPVVEGESPAPVAPLESEPAATPVPFAVRALGTDYEVDGAVANPDGSVVFTPEGAQRLHHLFGRAVLLNKRSQEIERDRAEIRAKHAAAEAFAKPLMEKWERLKQAQSMDEFQELTAELWLNREVIDGQMQLARDRAADAAYREPPPVSPDEYREVIERELDDEFTAAVRSMQAEPWSKGLNTEDWQRIHRDMRRVRTSFVVQQEDGLYYNEQAALAYAREQAEWVLAERRKLTATARQAQDAARKNAAAQVSAVKAPPGMGTSAPSGKPAAAVAKPQQASPNKPKTRAEREAERARYERWVMTGRED